MHKFHKRAHIFQTTTVRKEKLKWLKDHHGFYIFLVEK